MLKVTIFGSKQAKSMKKESYLHFYLDARLLHV